MPAVSFQNVSKTYRGERGPLRALDNVSFDIQRGEFFGLLGPNGAGKTTLISILAGLSHASDGRVEVMGHDVVADYAAARQSLGIVPQDTVLFNDTIEYNIAYGRPGATREQVEAAAKASHIHAFIAATPKGYDTTVGERGLKLSGGEKQRVAIARTLLKNPPILIFDEATSALDSANERAIQAELKSAARGKTALVIAHRLSTVVDAYRIIVLDGGRLVECGTHAELLARGARYAEMWRLQQAGEDSADGGRK